MILPTHKLINGIRFSPTPNPSNVARIDAGCAPLINLMHENGVLFDVRAARALGEELTQHIEEINSKITGMVGRRINVSSPKQVEELLSRDLARQIATAVDLLRDEGVNFKFQRGKSGGISTDAQTLTLLGSVDPVLNLILQCRELRKIKGTYVDALPRQINPETGRIHTTFSVTTARTGRMASFGPNLQNIPVRSKWGKLVRNLFHAAPGYKLISFDQSQIEMVMAGFYSQDLTMLDLFNRRLDIHTMTACTIFGGDYEYWQNLITLDDQGKLPPDLKSKLSKFKKELRLPCKTIGFGVLFGQTGQGMQLNIVAQGGPRLTLNRCDSLIDDWFTVYHHVKECILNWHRIARCYGMVWNLFGRHRLIPEVRSPHKNVVSGALRQVGNTPIQSGAGDILKIVMIEFYQLLTNLGMTSSINYNRSNEIVFDNINNDNYNRSSKLQCHPIRPLLAIHDELIFEVREDWVEEFRGMGLEAMTQTVQLGTVGIRSSSDVADRWGELK